MDHYILLLTFGFLIKLNSHPSSPKLIGSTRQVISSPSFFLFLVLKDPESKIRLGPFHPFSSIWVFSQLNSYHSPSKLIASIRHVTTSFSLTFFSLKEPKSKITKLRPFHSIFSNWVSHNWTLTSAHLKLIAPTRHVTTSFSL